MIVLLTNACSKDVGTPATSLESTQARLFSNVKISDCSALEIPKNTERNTNLDKVNKILEVSWYDETKNADIAYRIKYTDSNCSESVNELIKHVLTP